MADHQAGGVYRASEIDSPDGVDEHEYFPPGTASTVDAQCTSREPSACPAGTGVTFGPHRLTGTFDPNPRCGPGNEPGLMLRGLSAGRISSDTICFTFTLAGPPRPDSTYSIAIGTLRQDAAIVRFVLALDGLGRPHLLLDASGGFSHPRLRPFLPRASLDGHRLEVVVSDPFFNSHSAFLLQGSLASIQTDEPLLRRPIDAGDVAPGERV